jgi:predicted aspartyl protease
MMLARFLCGATVLVSLLTVPAMARTVKLVLEQSKAAAGGEAVDTLKAIRITYRLRQSGLEGRGTTLTDVVGGRTVTRYRLGPITGAEGFDGKRAWFQDTAGIVTAPEGGDAPARTVSAQYRRALAYWFPARGPPARVDFRMQLFRQRVKEALVVEPKGGLKFELWFDAQTKFLERVIEEGANETQTTSYEDYRPVGALRIPHRIRTSNAAAEFGTERTVTKVEINPALRDADFAVPPAPKADFAFTRGKTETVLPFRFANNHIYVDAKLNGRTFALLVDTGASNVITPTAARALKLRSVGDGQVKGAGELTASASFTRVRSVLVGDVRLNDQLFAVVPLEKLGDVEGVPFHGILGYELFKRFVVRVDYPTRTLTLSDAAQGSIANTGVAIPFVFNGTVPEVAGSIDGVAASFDIDTGSRASVGLNSPFVQRHALRARFKPSVEAVTGWGLGGATRGTVARVRDLRLGSVAIKDVVVDMSLQRQGVLSHAAPAGSIGSGLLKRFVVTFDYQRQRLYLRRHASSGERDAFDRSGLWINLGEGGFRVDGVVLGSPAARAGIANGDVIVSIDGRTSSSLALDDVRDRLRDAAVGTRVVLTVRSGGRTRDAVIVLRDLI